MKILTKRTFYFYCPGCKENHALSDQWEYNEDPAKPTFKPSIKISTTQSPNHKRITKCHSYITDGKIKFLSDCKHELAGQTVDLPEVVIE